MALNIGANNGNLPEMDLAKLVDDLLQTEQAKKLVGHPQLQQMVAGGSDGFMKSITGSMQRALAPQEQKYSEQEAASESAAAAAAAKIDTSIPSSIRRKETAAGSYSYMDAVADANEALGADASYSDVQALTDRFYNEYR